VSVFPVTELDGRVRFAVRVHPRSSRVGIDGVHGSALRVRVTAPPVEGAANEALIAVLADALDVAKRAVRIVAGSASRTKTVEIDGVGAADVRRIAGRGSPDDAPGQR
jgi:uncharacterized protein (TIGR00251 family)